MLQHLNCRHNRQPLSSSHVCESTHPSPCEHHQDMLRCMARGWQAWLRYQSSAARAKRATSRALAIIAAHASSRRHSSAKRRRAAFFSGCIFSHGIFNGDRDLPCCGPRCYSRLRVVRRRGSARAFAASKLHFSEKLRSAVGKVYPPVQRVRSAVQPDPVRQPVGPESSHGVVTIGRCAARAAASGSAVTSSQLR